MKQFSIILSMAIAVFSFTTVNAQSEKAKTDSIATDTVVYQCPMKCEGDKTYDKAGKCPKCNMNLSKVKIRKNSTEHIGHNHN